MQKPLLKSEALYALIAAHFWPAFGSFCFLCESGGQPGCRVLRLPQWLESQKVACWPRPDKALGSHKISAQKFKFVRSFLTVGASVLMTDIDVVYLQNPFDHLWRDADIEGTTDGWDDGSAYGWLEQLDDPSLGAYGRFRPAMRITARNSEAEHVFLCPTSAREDRIPS